MARDYPRCRAARRRFPGDRPPSTPQRRGPARTAPLGEFRSTGKGWNRAQRSAGEDCLSPAGQCARGRTCPLPAAATATAVAVAVAPPPFSPPARIPRRPRTRRHRHRHRRSSKRSAHAAAVAPPTGPIHDLVIRGGTIYDGSGGAPFVGDVAIDGDTIAEVAPFALGKTVVEARGLAVAPGFVNMLSHALDSLAFDGRGESDVRQGVTLEVIGETSPYPFGGKMQALADSGIAVNIAGLVATSTARAQSMSLKSRHPSPVELQRMRAVVARAMDEGALGLTSALIYTPDEAFSTDELVGAGRGRRRQGRPLRGAHAQRGRRAWSRRSTR